MLTDEQIGKIAEKIYEENEHHVDSYKWAIREALELNDKANAMKAVKIDRKDWAPGLDKLFTNYRLFGPVKDDQLHQFKELNKGELPDFIFLNTPLSPKSIIYPQSELMFKYTLDEKHKDHHIMQEVDKDYSPRAVIGIRPCDAASFLLVRKNFDTPEYKDPYWIRAYDTITFVGLACQSPCSSCFCTTAGCGPFHEEGLDGLLIESGDHYLVKIFTEPGQKLLRNAGWDNETDADFALKEIEYLKQTAEAKITSIIMESVSDSSSSSSMTYTLIIFAPQAALRPCSCSNCIRLLAA